MVFPPPPPPPPQETIPAVTGNKIKSNPSTIGHLLRRFGIPNNSTKASEAPPAASQPLRPSFGEDSAEMVEEVVVIVRVAVVALDPVMLTEFVDPKLNVGGFIALAGLDVIAAVSVTTPVKPPPGVTVMEDVLPVVAPADTATGAPLILKLGGGRLMVKSAEATALAA